jgi:hypothetical protein
VLLEILRLALALALLADAQRSAVASVPDALVTTLVVAGVLAQTPEALVATLALADALAQV